MVLTLLGCGTAVFVGCGEPAGVFAIAAAFGLAVIAMAYTIGGIIGAAVLFWIISATGAPGAMGSPDGMGADGVANAGGALASLVWNCLACDKCCCKKAE